MAQANPFDQFDSQAQPVPMQSLQPIIGANPIAAEAEARQAESAEATIAGNTFRTMTAAEVAAQGLPADGVYQINGLGEVKVIQEAPKAEKGAVNKETAAMNVARQLGELRTIFNRSFAGAGPMQSLSEFLPSDDRQKFQALVRTMRADLKPLIRGPGEGTFTEGDQRLLDELLPDPNRFDAYNEQIFSEIENRVKGVLGDQAIAPATTPPTRAAAEGEAFLTDQDKELQTKLSEAFAAGATRDELNAIAAPYGQNINNVTQEELDRVRAAGGGISVVPTGRNIPDPRDQMGFIEGIGETLTGNARETAETEALADWTDMPELNSLSVDSFQAALGTMMTNPAESVAIIRAQFPGVRVRQDANGNFILRSSADGKEYAIKPGFRMSDVPRIGGALAAFTPAGRATSLAGGFTAGAGTQAVIEGTQAATGGEFNPGEVVAAGAGGTGGVLLGRGVNAITSGRAAAQPAAQRIERDAADIIATGEREGVPVMTSDVRRPRTWFGNWLQGTGEKLPVVGTGGIRAGQQESRVAMIEKLADEYAATPASIDDVTADFMKTRGAEVGKFTEQKREVFSQLAGAPPPVAQNSLDALDMAIGRYGPQGTFRDLTAKLQTWRSDLANARSIDDIESLRKSIGDTFQDESLKSASSAMRDIVNGPKGLYAAIKKDMGSYIRDNAGEQGLAKWSAANAKLADFADDLGKSTLDRVLKKGEATPEEAASLLFSKKPSDVKALFRNLSPDGQQRARALVVQKLVDDAGGLAELSTAKFRNAMARSADTFGVVFPKAEADRMAGMLRLLQATRRAEQASVTTPTGQSTLPFIGAGGLGFLAGDWFGAAGVGAATAASFRAYESKAMRNLLVALSKTQPGSKAEGNVLANIGKVAARTAAPTAASQTRSEQQPATKIEVR